MSLEVLTARFNPAVLEASADSIVVIDGRGRIVWANRGWFEFGTRNGARPDSIAVGVNYFAPAIDDIRVQLQSLLTESREKQEPFDFDYECSSSRTFRVFRLHGLPLADGHFLLIHSLRVEHAHEEPTEATLLATCVDASGFIRMCAHCRRVARADHSAWVWVPEWLNAPPAPVTHGLCPTCTGFYWGRLATTRVLVVKADPAARDATVRRLTEAGYEVVSSGDVSDARRRLEASPYDALITDQSLPVGAAQDLIRWVTDHSPVTACILLAGNVPEAPPSPVLRVATRSTAEKDLLELLPPAM